MAREASAGLAGDRRRVALLRGINVGTAKRIAMADLRAVVEGLGFRDVRTLLNSGNVVFTVPSGRNASVGRRLESAIKQRLRVVTRVSVLTGGELALAIKGNPLRAVADDPSRLLIMAFTEAEAVKLVQPLMKERWAPEALALGTRVAYLWCAHGIAKGRLWTEANRAVGDAGTTRNLATMTKLLALVDSVGESDDA